MKGECWGSRGGYSGLWAVVVMVVVVVVAMGVVVLVGVVVVDVVGYRCKMSGCSHPIE